MLPVVFPPPVFPLFDCDLHAEMPMSKQLQGQEVDTKKDTAPEVLSSVCFR
jgi:hypothetical protein